MKDRATSLGILDGLEGLQDPSHTASREHAFMMIYNAYYNLNEMGMLVYPSDEPTPIDDPGPIDDPDPADLPNDAQAQNALDACGERFIYGELDIAPFRSADELNQDNLEKKILVAIGDIVQEALDDLYGDNPTVIEYSIDFNEANPTVSPGEQVRFTLTLETKDNKENVAPKSYDLTTVVNLQTQRTHAEYCREAIDIVMDILENEEIVIEPYTSSSEITADDLTDRVLDAIMTRSSEEFNAKADPNNPGDVTVSIYYYGDEDELQIGNKVEIVVIVTPDPPIEDFKSGYTTIVVQL